MNKLDNNRLTQNIKADHGTRVNKTALRFTCTLSLSLFAFGCTYEGVKAVNQAQISSPARPKGQTGKWHLVFRDEFGGSKLNANQWVTCYWWDDGGCTIATNNELQWYQPENVFLRDGKLVLRAQEESVTTPDGRKFNYTSGMVSTGTDTYKGEDHRSTFKHVYIEVKAKIPEGKGLWPALWLLPADHESLPEIDAMEVLGDDPDELHMTFHYLDEEGNRNRESHTWTSPEPLMDWHVFALDWQPRGITWYVDGVKRSHYPGDERYVPDEPMYLIANLAVGGDWPGAPDADTPFPSDFEIDYVRIWVRD